MDQPSGKPPSLPGARLLWLAPAALFAWIAAWAWRLGPTLINDEYAAIDYFYRVVENGHWFPTPFKLHKPLSLAMGVFAWAAESPLAYELAVAAFAALFLVLFYLSLRREFGPLAAAVAGLAVMVHPDLVYYSVTGSAVIPFAALTFGAILAAQHRQDRPAMLWVFALCALLGGLSRPESWLLGAPAILWWWPGRDRKQWLRLLIALAIIGMGPVIWFGKDWLINDNFFHSMAVATRDKTVGTGAPFDPWKVTEIFFLRMIPQRVSWPFTIAGFAGLVLFIRQRGLRQGLCHPFVIMPLLVGAYVWLIVYGGVFPVARYWFFDALFLLAFAAYLGQRLGRAADLHGSELAGKVVFWAATLAALAYFIERPQNDPPDGRWLLAALAFAAIALAAGLLIGADLIRKPRSSLALIGLLVLILSYPVFAAGLARRQLDELELEAKVQAEMVTVSNFLRERIPPGRSHRIMIPSRRNEQLNWLFRKRETPDTVTFREAFFLVWGCREPDKSNYPRDPVRREVCEKIGQRDFLALHPDWLVYVPGDYQYWAPQRMFDWLGHQDHTVLQGVAVDLVLTADPIRVFRVTYPESYPPKGPLPPIP